MRCEQCDRETDPAFRFCPWCAQPLRSKLVEFFRAHPLIESEPVALRVSRYLTGTRHVRLSIWNECGVEAAVSLEEREARRLAAFLAPQPPPRRRRRDRAKRLQPAEGAPVSGRPADRTEYSTRPDDSPTLC